MGRSDKRSLRLRKETLRRLDAAELGQVGGGARKPQEPVYFDLQAYLRACMGTNYTTIC